MDNGKQTDEPVIFRRWRDKDGGVIALFPANPADFVGMMCASYEHVGQHGAADYAGVMRQTRPAAETDPDVAALKAELEGLGYSLAVCKRQTKAHRAEYRACLAAMR
jgi:hypothetical protein